MSNLEKNSPKKDEARGATGQHTGQNNGQFLQATVDSIYPKHGPSQVSNLIVTPTQEDLLAAMEREPLLTDFGMGIFAAYRLTQAERIADFERNRELLKKRLDMFRLCCQWLALCERRKTVNLTWTSYHLKHRVEAYYGVYVTNGAFCASVIHSGIAYKTYSGRPNITIAISNKLPKEGGRVHV